MLKRIGLGLCLLLLCVIVLLAMDLQDYNTANHVTVQFHTLYIQTHILASLFEVISGIGGVISLLASLELTVAQSLVHMRGLMMGIYYGAIGVFIALSYVIYVPYTLIHSHCTLYYHVTVSVCVVVTISVYNVLAKRYKLQ